MRLTALLRPCVILGLTALTACGSLPPRTADTPATTTSAPPSAPLKIGIALGGGAAKGFAHIGVIKMLEANGFAPAVVSGTSAGSVVGALYASGMNAFELQEKAVSLDEAKIRDLQLSSGGLVQGQKLEDYVNQQVQRKPLEQLSKPFVAVATRLEDGARTVFARGNTGQAVRASSSVPGVFQPVSIGGHDYVDGGLVEPVPVDAAREMGAEFVIAVNISADPSSQKNSGQGGVLLQTTAIMGQSINKMALARADVVIRPDLPDMGGSDFASRNRAILAGEQATAAALPALREKLAAARTRPATPGTVATQ